jgi:hypothetical protein
VALANFFSAIKSFVPAACTFSVDNGGDSIDPLNGQLMGSWGVGTSGPIVCTGTGNFSLASGLLVRWDTGTIINGHRLRGKTYIVPVVVGNYDSVGGVLTGTQTTVTTAAQAYVTAAGGTAVVWNRPKPGQAGGFSAVTTASVAPKVAVLRSRRD